MFKVIYLDCKSKKGRKTLEKISFLKNVEILLKTREGVLNSFKTILSLTHQ